MSGYVPIFRSIVQSTVWQTPPPTRCVWFALMMLADRNGVVEASVPGLAREAVVTLDECEEALAVFLSPDRYSRTKSDEGRRIEAIDGGWRILNYVKYRDKLMDMRAAEQNRRRVARCKAKARANRQPSEAPPCTPPQKREEQNTNTNTNVNTKGVMGCQRVGNGMVTSGNGHRASNHPGKIPPSPISDPDEMAELKRRCHDEPTKSLQERAALCVENPYDGHFEQPQRWPEVMAMAACFADAYGAPHKRLGQIPQDKGLATLLGILAAGITHREYFRAVELSLQDDWFRKIKGPGLTTLTLEQCRRMLAEADERGVA